MKIVVCLKHVPAQTDVRIDQATGQLKTEGISWVINPWDEYAIEEAVRIKEKLPGSTVTAICLGSPASETALRDAIAVGVDEGILLTDPAFEGSDSMVTATILAVSINRIGIPGLILCGRHATDGNTGQVGAALAEKLDIPHVSFVKKLEEVSENSLKLQRATEEGYDVLEAGLPLLITVLKEINEPRIPSLKGKMAAKKAAITRWGMMELGLKLEETGSRGSAVRLIKKWAPPPRPTGETITGSPQEKAATLVKKLRERGLL